MEAEQFTFRNGFPEDVHSLRALAIQTFQESYEAFNDPKNFQTYVQKAFQLAQIQSELEDSNGSFFLCQKENLLVGYAKLHRVNSPQALAGQKVIELQRIYVLEEMKGKGIGKRLLQLSLDTARRESYQQIWLGVWKKNPYAIEFYRRQGFSIIGDHQFVMGDEVQTDWVMARSL